MKVTRTGTGNGPTNDCLKLLDPQHLIIMGFEIYLVDSTVTNR
jgi:hypothetical protein